MASPMLPLAYYLLYTRGQYKFCHKNLQKKQMSRISKMSIYSFSQYSIRILDIIEDFVVPP